MAAHARKRWIELGAVLLLAIAVSVWIAQDPYAPGRLLMTVVAPEVIPPVPAAEETPVTLRGPAGELVQLSLELIANGFPMPTDMQFPPGSDDEAIVLEKGGRAQWLHVQSGEHGESFRVEVLQQSEEGLLGLAFHPQFAQNGRLFLNYVAAEGKRHMTRIAEWHADKPADLAHCQAPCMRAVRVLFQVEQPFSNHNAGQLAFGPDGFLYIGFGDGGLRDDPYGHAQNLETRLGSMLRIDVDHTTPGRSYAIPADNPFLGRARVPPETWAYGLRNPWRYSFDPKGRLIVADVGQDRWEEVSIVQAGDNLGWDLKEGFACPSEAAKCTDGSLVDPIYVYGRKLGACITGGYVYTGSRVPALRGKYVFGDFVSGRLFALDLPDDRKQRREATQLGRFSIAPSAFAQDAKGELYVLNFARAEVLRLSQITR